MTHTENTFFELKKSFERLIKIIIDAPTSAGIGGRLVFIDEFTLTYNAETDTIFIKGVHTDAVFCINSLCNYRIENTPGAPELIKPRTTYRILVYLI